MQKLKNELDPTLEDHDSYFKKQLKDQNNKIEDLQRTQTALQHAQGQRHGQGTPLILANLAIGLLGDLIDECIFDVLADVHKDMKQSSDICQICQTRCRSHIQKPGCDIFGKSYNVNNLPSYECVNCQKMIASTRYAPHLEKCLGLAGRQSSRVANRRMVSSPSSSIDYSSDSNDERKRKKLPSSPLSSGSKLKKHRLFDDI